MHWQVKRTVSSLVQMVCAVAEMVRALSWTTLLLLYLLFLLRLGGWETEKLEAWNEVMLTAIPKKTDKVGLQSMRYISLLLVLQKFYNRA